MPRHKFTKEERVKGGEISKRKTPDERWADAIETHLASIDEAEKISNYDVLLICAMQQFKVGNSKPLQLLIERGYGKSKQLTETRDLTAEDSPIYRAIKEIKNGK